MAATCSRSAWSLDRAQRAAQVVPFPREQAGIEPAVGRQPGAGAAAAERLGDRGDHADLTGAVAVAVAAGDLPVVGGRDRIKRPLPADQRDDLRGGGDLLPPPAPPPLPCPRPCTR